MRRGIAVAALFACAACGSSGSEGAGPSVNGTIAGETLVAREAISFVLDEGLISMGVIVVTDAQGVCAKATAGQEPKSMKGITFMLNSWTGTREAPPTATGAYTIHPGSVHVDGNEAHVRYGATDESCDSTHDIDATSGTVTLTSIDSGAYAGTFDVTFADGSHVTGSFKSTRCSAFESLPTLTCEGASTTGTATVNGTIAGRTIAAQDAVSNVADEGTGLSVAAVVIADVPQVCAKMTAGQEPKSMQLIGFLMGTRTDSGISPPAAPGVHTVLPPDVVVSGSFAVVKYGATGPTCNTLVELDGISGTVTLTDVHGGAYSGTFDVTFGDGSHATGSFTSARCRAMGDGVSGTCT